MPAQSLTSRFYQTENDLRQMQTLLVQARSQTDDWRYAHVGDLNFWFFMVACHLDPTQHIRLWHVGDQLVGYAILGEDPSFDCQVLPDFTWQGIEDDALTWAEARITDLRQVDLPRWGGNLVSGARQDDPQRIAFLEQHGFRPGGRFSEVNMLCRLDGSVDAPTVPPGYQVRAVVENDPDEISNRAEVQRAVWLPWTVGEVTAENYASFMGMPGYHPDLDIVAVAPDGVIVAYVNGWIDPLNKIGDFGPLGSHPNYRRLGLTRAVLLECLRRMQAYGMDRVSVSTGLTNSPAIRLYESVGFRAVNEYIEYVKAGRDKQNLSQ